jgi:3',5'-cyclic-AMP phosphodiesterase
LRLIQFTDTHLIAEQGATLHGVDTYLSLKLCLNKALGLPKPIDAIVVTGDIAEDGSEKSYSNFKEIFENLKVPVYVMPGNHDDITKMQKVFQGTNIAVKSHALLGNWLLILCNSQVLGQSHGLVSENELASMCSLISQHSEKWVSIALHHPIQFPCPSPGCKIQNEEVLAEILMNFKNVRFVISGHVHSEFKKQHSHICYLATPSTFALCHHSNARQDVDINDFWKSHALDQSKKGFRVLDLNTDGKFDSEVHWL